MPISQQEFRRSHTMWRRAALKLGVVVFVMATTVAGAALGALIGYVTADHESPPVPDPDSMLDVYAGAMSAVPEDAARAELLFMFGAVVGSLVGVGVVRVGVRRRRRTVGGATHSTPGPHRNREG